MQHTEWRNEQPAQLWEIKDEKLRNSPFVEKPYSR